MSGCLNGFSEVIRFLFDAGKKSFTGRWHFVASQSEILRHIHVRRIFPTDKVSFVGTESDGWRLQSSTFFFFLFHPDRVLEVLLQVGQAKGKEVADDESEQESNLGHLEQSSHPFFSCDNVVNLMCVHKYYTFDTLMHIVNVSKYSVREETNTQVYVSHSEEYVHTNPK